MSSGDEHAVWVQSGCESNACVQVRAIGEGTVAIRSNELPLDKLRVTREEWVAFLLAAKSGVFDEV